MGETTAGGFTLDVERMNPRPSPYSFEMDVTFTDIRNVLTRTGGYLKTVTSHSLQPYRGCTLGRSLCGVGCYVQHNRWLTKGQAWGSFLEVRLGDTPTDVRAGAAPEP